MKASDLIADFLAAQGVTHVYEMIGGMITHLIDSIAQRGQIRIVSMHHEQGAAFAVDGHARMNGVPMVAMATSGPGATNLLTGIGSCHFDSVPAVFITGQVNRHELKRDRPIRQLGFQETDIVAMAAPITKGAWRVEDPTTLQAHLVAAFRLAMSGRPGPVLLDLPMDIQRVDLPAWTQELIQSDPPRLPAAADLTAALACLANAARPLILVGGGLRAAGAVERFRELLTQLQIPVVHSLMGVDVLPIGHPLRVGLIGSYGNRWSNHALGSADALLVLGSRLDIRQTGADTAAFSAGREIIHVDCEAGEINNRLTQCHAIHADVGAFIAAALIATQAAPLAAPTTWIEHIETLRSRHPDTAELRDIIGLNPNHVIHRLCDNRNPAAMVVDVGQHQMWSAQSCQLGPTTRFLTSGGMGSMGFALPAAIGVAFASPGRPVLVVAGDGGFQCNIQELQTVRHDALPLKMVVFDNGCHGMVRQFQESYFEGRYQSTKVGYDAPDFARVAEAYGIAGLTVATPEQLECAITWLYETSEPRLLVIKIDAGTNVYPKLAFGKPITEMEPEAKPIDMEGT